MDLWNRTNIENQKLLSQIDEIVKQKQYRILDYYQEESVDGQNSRKKHNRRTAKEIAKDFNCPYQSWDKKYGSEGSLNLHMKLKHDGGNKTDREKLAVSFMLSLNL